MANVHRVNVNFSEEAYAELSKLAERKGRALSEELRDAIAADRWYEESSGLRDESALDSADDTTLRNQPAKRRLDLTITEISDQLITELGTDPTLLHRLDPRKFEALVAELYRRRGFETQLTPYSGDQGVDVFVSRHDDLGSTLWVVQAKRYGLDRKVGANAVRELLGTIDAQGASAGVLITTSFFEPGADQLQSAHEHRLTLHNYLKLQDMLVATPKS